MLTLTNSWAVDVPPTMTRGVMELSFSAVHSQEKTASTPDFCAPAGSLSINISSPREGCSYSVVLPPSLPPNGVFEFTPEGKCRNIVNNFSEQTMTISYSNEVRLNDDQFGNRSFIQTAGVKVNFNGRSEENGNPTPGSYSLSASMGGPSGPCTPPETKLVFETNQWDSKDPIRTSGFSDNRPTGSNPSRTLNAFVYPCQSMTLLVRDSGDGQRGGRGQTLPNPLVAKLIQNGAPLAGEGINFSIESPANGAALSSSGNTDSSGKAHASLALGNTLGSYRIKATYPDTCKTQDAFFTAIATAATISGTLPADALAQGCYAVNIGDQSSAINPDGTFTIDNADVIFASPPKPIDNMTISCDVGYKCPVANAMPSVRPLESTYNGVPVGKNCGCGSWSSPRKNGGTHKALDIGGAIEADVLAARTGTVIWVGPIKSNKNIAKQDEGWCVVMQSEEKVNVSSRNPEGLYEFLAYCHLDPRSRPVSIGQKINTGTVLGKIGRTGNSFDCQPHVHFTRRLSHRAMDTTIPAPKVPDPGVRTDQQIPPNVPNITEVTYKAFFDQNNNSKIFFGGQKADPEDVVRCGQTSNGLYAGVKCLSK